MYTIKHHAAVSSNEPDGHLHYKQIIQTVTNKKKQNKTYSKHHLCKLKIHKYNIFFNDACKCKNIAFLEWPLVVGGGSESNDSGEKGKIIKQKQSQGHANVDNVP